MNKYGFKDTEWEIIQQILKDAENVEKAVLFGSRAMNTFKPMSDVDIVVYGDKLKHSDIVRLETAFEDSNLPQMFDVVRFDSIKSEELLKHVEKCGVVVFERYEEWTRVLFEDYIDISKTKVEQEKVKLENYISTDNMLPNLGGIERANNLPKQLKFVAFDAGDVLFSNIRTYFKKVWRAEFSGGCSNDVLVFKSKDQNKLLQDFMYYVVSSDNFIDYTALTAKGTKMPRGDKEAIKKYSFLLPELKEQKEISKTLSSLDKKINLLRQQNQTLEELAQTFFKRWFVDFEFPNEKGEPYKSSGGKMTESELGEIPEGWGLRSLSSIADYLNGLACQKYPVENEEEKMPVLKIKELGNGISTITDWATSNVESKYIVHSGDIIFSWSGTLMLKVWGGEDCVLNQHLFKVTSETYPKWFIYQWTGIHLRHFIEVAKSKATTMGHIKRSHLDEAICVVPNMKILDESNKVFEGLFNSQVNNNKEIQSLTRLQDTLLPKLMNGNIKFFNFKVK